MDGELTTPLRSRRKVAGIVWLLGLAVCFAPYISGRWTSSERRLRRVTIPNSSPDRVTTSKLRIVSFNIAHGRGCIDSNWSGTSESKQRRIEEVAATLRDLNADVVVLNEVDFNATWSGHRNQAEELARLAGFPHRVEQRNFDLQFVYGRWQFGNAILSKFPIVDSQFVEFPCFAGWEAVMAGSKQGVVATLEVANQQRLRILGVHLEPRSETTRVAAARRIVSLEHESPIPLIVAGDFNSTPTGFPGSEVDPEKSNAIDLLRRSGRFRFHSAARPVPDELTFPAARPNVVIDWIVIPPEWTFDEYQILQLRLSDHRPVVATVELSY